ncbi:MAG TPA: outer membrane beta-barrel protein [Sphingomicrobium sp.]|jgi:opacity protein-like surface antigen|nr:outer membrane beta-barrel protein [Sphingomicrobium sp.]
MRRYLLAAVAAAAIATPALARDGSPYVGIEGGLMIVEDMDQDVTLGTDRFDDGIQVDFKRGIDVDAIAGYDFGPVRVEGELGYKRLRADEVLLSPALNNELGLGIGGDAIDVSSNGSVVSLMGNALLDFGDDDGWSGYIGGGVGRARVKIGGDRDSAFAWQLIAGVRKAITSNIDLGLKYRFFNTSDLKFSDDFDSDVTGGISSRGKLNTHSLLASLIFNFGAPPAPVVVAPPVVETPPPPPPATQTCYDGSVILATDVCPQPPVETPPPPPEPTPERG